MSFRVCLVGVVLFLTTHGVFAQAVSDSSDSKLPRPEWLPANAKRLEVETKFLLAEGVGAERVDLGRLRTAQPYYFEVPFVNMLDRQVKITDLKSSCGCMVAARDDRRVGVGAASSFMVLVDAQQVPGRYAKTVTMITDAGIAWPFLVSAQFESHFKLSPARIKPDGKLKPIILTLTPQFTEAREYSVRVKALSGYLRVVGTTRGDYTWLGLC